MIYDNDRQLDTCRRNGEGCLTVPKLVDKGQTHSTQGNGDLSKQHDAREDTYCTGIPYTGTVVDNVNEF